MTDITEFRAIASNLPADEGVEKRPSLIMIEGDFIGQVYVLKNDVTRIGRDDDVELVLSDTLISRQHAIIENRVDGFYFSDLGSTNGCLLNREQISRPARLNEGDKITLGDVVFKFSYQDEDDARYHGKLRNMAVKDGLTHIYNKRYFTETLEKEFTFSQRNATGLALVLFDIDHFKQINDKLGHTTGDYTLKQLAHLIEQDVRGYDVFARYGGEEFVFLLKGESLGSAIALAERVRVAIERHNFSYNSQGLKITISLGVTWWNGDASISEPEKLIEAADKRLYQAKSDGRNCVRHDPL